MPPQLGETNLQLLLGHSSGGQCHPHTRDQKEPPLGVLNFDAFSMLFHRMVRWQFSEHNRDRL